MGDGLMKDIDIDLTIGLGTRLTRARYQAQGQ